MKNLELKFKNVDGKIVTLSLEEPIDPIDPDEVNRVMDEIIAADAFTSKGGGLVEKYSAQITERYVQEIELTE